MARPRTRREFLAHSGAAAAGAVLYGPALAAAGEHQGGPRARVVIARDDALTRGEIKTRHDLLCTLLDAAMQKLTRSPDARAAWLKVFPARARVGIKVNTLGLSTQPAVVDAIVAGLLRTGLPAENIHIWDRFDCELAGAGFKLNKSSQGVQCWGTDAEHYGSGYQRKIETSGDIGSCFSRIVSDRVDTLISVPVLKDHNLAGVSLGMKNFYGAIHNPNKYHDRNCDPYIVDVMAHRFIAPKWRLTICDATLAQYHGGPTRHPGFAWPFGGLIVSDDVVAADAVAADLLEGQRRDQGLPALAEENRPATHIASASRRGFGQSDLSKVERIEV